MLYNKYRPEKFGQVLGQATAVTLSNSIVKERMYGRIIHTHLFSGARGIGKTTLARIYANVLNCKKPLGSEPCGKCAACKTRTYREIDAGIVSGKGAAEKAIRWLANKPRFRYRVLIIDEAHSLSKKAMVAFLKTAEEPPPQSILIFCTTEPEKLDKALRSRCTWWPLRTVSKKAIARLLLKIARKEKIKLTIQAAEMIAISAEGSPRSALSFLESVRNLTGKITSERVGSILAIVDVNPLMDCILERRFLAILAESERLASFYTSNQILVEIAKKFSDIATKAVKENEPIHRQRFYVAAATYAYVESKEYWTNYSAHLQLVLLKILEASGWLREHKTEVMGEGEWEAFCESIEAALEFGLYEQDLYDEACDMRVQVMTQTKRLVFTGFHPTNLLKEAWYDYTESEDWNIVEKPFSQKSPRRKRIV